MKKTLVILSAILLVASCEDCFDLDTNCDEPIIVIEGSINDLDKKSVITLSETSDYFTSEACGTVSTATVEVTDDKGITINFEETESGVYTSENMQGVENTAYTLHVVSDGKSYKAQTTMPQKVDIDSLSFETTPPTYEFHGGYVINCHLHDPVQYENYYRLKVYNLNDSSKGDESKYVFNDDIVNGNDLIIQWKTEQFKPNDIVVVELQTLDQSIYNYYYNLFSISEAGLGNSFPANPETNIDNDALGCFGSYTISRDTIIILPY